MEIPNLHKNRYFYHFTHIDNLESIIKSEGLLSTNEKKKLGINHHDIANEIIQKRRDEMMVTVEPYGTVHDYVPFYFSSKSIMLLSLINEKKVDQEDIIFLAVSIDRIMENNVVFTSASANTVDPPQFFNHPDNLDELNWKCIDSQAWNESSDEEKHQRMAEVLIKDRVPLDWIDGFIVYDESTKQKVIELYKKYGLDEPGIQIDHRCNRYFYFKKFFIKGREEESLVHGPRKLRELFYDTVKEIIDYRDNRGVYALAAFDDIIDAITKIENNFCVIPELEGIYGLQTSNPKHKKTVSDHTISVVNKIQDKYNGYYKNLSDDDKNIVILAAYFHDIGKGPAEKWDDGIQPPYLDHPADSLKLVSGILKRKFKYLNDDEIRKICLLVAYHDLLGDIKFKAGRSIEELKEIGLCKNEVKMLAALSYGDCKDVFAEEKCVVHSKSFDTYIKIFEES